MEKHIYYNDLFDIYQSFFTDNNKKVFIYYYQENLSMQEIAELLSVSKSFIGSTIKKMEQKLDSLENELQIYKTKQKLNDLLSINDLSTIKKEIESLI